MSSERLIDNDKNPWWGEHIHRYEEAAKIIKGHNASILDIACGTGFGSFYLASLGHQVIGGDLSEDTILDCAKKYKNIHLTFQQMNGTRLPFQNEMFNAVISFETIEHTVDFQLMLSEFKRVVKRNGIIILSTPNILINSPSGIIVNKYHTQEWTYEEFLELLNSNFSEINIFGQQYTRYKNQLSFKFKMSKFIESVLYKRGFRKIPLFLQDKIIRYLINLPMYPTASDYRLTNDISEIKKCKTFFAVCSK